MFDPTAFENLRVLLEGIFYDKDIEGKIMIVDRNDTINTAKLSRAYDLTFQLIPSLQVTDPQITCKVRLEASLENLTAELLPALHMTREAGGILSIEFMFDHGKDEFFLKQIEKILRDHWKYTTIKQTITYEPLKKGTKVKHHEWITFDRILKEEQMNELPEIAQQIMTTLLQMEFVINR
jgi:hypothetical protein